MRARVILDAGFWESVHILFTRVTLLDVNMDLGG